MDQYLQLEVNNTLLALTNEIRVFNLFLIIAEPVPVMPMAAFQIYDDLSDAWSQEDDEISDHYLHLRLSLKVIIAADILL